jgi:hypothetical protein
MKTLEISGFQDLRISGFKEPGVEKLAPESNHPQILRS